MSSYSTTYGEAIRHGFSYLLERHREVFVLGQGLWSPWYVGNSMTDLDVEFGRDRVIDTPVSEQASTGAGVGAALVGKRPIVMHPRLDFMILAVDQIVTQAANWSSMFGQPGSVPLVVRGIINRGGEQGAQHSQALHAWFAHIPGLRVVMPATVQDARDLLISATLCDDPVLYIDDRWLYEDAAEIATEPDLDAVYSGPKLLREGSDATLVACGYSTKLALEAARVVAEQGASVDVVDLRCINPLKMDIVIDRVLNTGRLVSVDGGWTSCGLAGEVIARVAESVEPRALRSKPERVTLLDAPAPTSRPLEKAYYTSVADVVAALGRSLGKEFSVD